MVINMAQVCYTIKSIEQIEKMFKNEIDKNKFKIKVEKSNGEICLTGDIKDIDKLMYDTDIGNVVRKDGKMIAWFPGRN